MNATVPCSRERGSMTVIMVCVIAGALLLAVLVAGLVRAQTVRGQAQAAADLAALAAAEVAAVGDPDACATAHEVAARNEAKLQDCTVETGAKVTVRTAVSTQVLPGWVDTGIGRARAGPVARSEL